MFDRIRRIGERVDESLPRVGRILLRVVVIWWLVVAPLIAIVSSTLLAQPAAPMSTQRDCWGDYERAIWQAWLEKEACQRDIRLDPANPMQTAWWAMGGRLSCEITWLGKSESAWFQFLACSAVPDWK